MSVVNTNINTNSILNSIANNTTLVNTALNQLSTGLNINSAGQISASGVVYLPLSLFGTLKTSTASAIAARNQILLNLLNP